MWYPGRSLCISVCLSFVLLLDISSTLCSAGCELLRSTGTKDDKYTLCNILRGQPYLLLHHSSVSIACYSIISGLLNITTFSPTSLPPNHLQEFNDTQSRPWLVRLRKGRIWLVRKRHFKHPPELTRKRYLTPRLCENESDLGCRLRRRHPSFKWDRRLGGRTNPDS